MTPEEIAFLNWQGMQAHQQGQLALQQQRQQQRQNDLLSWEYANQQNQARQANESRYADILQLLGINRNDVLGDINSWGESQIQDANQRYKEQEARGVADAYSRGFGGSPSVMNAARNQANRSRDAEINRIRDNQIAQRASASERLTGNIAGVMERRNDVPPDLNQLIGLQQGLGQAGPLLGSPYPRSVAGTPGGGWGSQPGQVGLPGPRDPMQTRAPSQPQPYYPVELYGGAGVQNPYFGGAGKMGAQQAYRPFSPPPAAAAPAFVGHTGYGEYRQPTQVPRNFSPGYNSGTAPINSQYTMVNGQYMPLVAPVRQQVEIGGIGAGAIPDTGYGGGYLAPPWSGYGGRGSYGPRPMRFRQPSNRNLMRTRGQMMGRVGSLQNNQMFPMMMNLGVGSLIPGGMGYGGVMGRPDYNTYGG